MKPVLFVCRSPLDFYVVKNVYKEMKDVAEVGVVSLFDSAFWASKREKMVEYISDIVKINGVDPKIFRPTDWKFLQEYKVAVYNSGIGKASPCKLVRIPYSQAKSQAVHNTQNGIYDLICAPGEHWAKAMEQYKSTTKTVITGAPKFDDWFSNNVTEAGMKDFEYLIVKDKSKKTVLYAPTWGEVSTCHLCHDQILEVAKHYNLIIKLHDGTYWQEKIRWQKFQQAGIQVVNGNVDIQQLYKLVDYVINDNSGGIFEAILVDKPLVLIDRPFTDGIGTVSWSAEQVNRDAGIRVRITDPASKFIDALKAYEKNPMLKATERKRVRDQFFSLNDGNCGKRCAEEIRKLL